MTLVKQPGTHGVADTSATGGQLLLPMLRIRTAFNTLTDAVCIMSDNVQFELCITRLLNGDELLSFGFKARLSEEKKSRIDVFN